ncbi:hypothetical protein HPULCUR_011680 [Helicostylum pulchrum]|uniref:Uncharacterized protein n=1 Tax=Helicostylum pulchrum TaxID=562976 RepID=A0ABP9YHI8_9FUNG
MTCREFPDVKKSVIKYLVYEHVLDQTLSSNPVAGIPDNILTSLSQDVKDAIQAFINPLIAELKNRLPSFSITKASQSKDPFGILPALRHILSKYETLIAESSITQTHSSHPVPSQDISNSSSIKKGKEKEDNKGENKPKFVPPRLSSLFPNPGLQ